MCGIVGIVGPEQVSIDLVEAQTSLRAIRHRGPDDEGYLLVNTQSWETQPCKGRDTDPRTVLSDIQGYTSGRFNMVLGHRRLSILDLSPLGHQPMKSENGRYWIVYNGEIYNYLELKEELSRKGHLFRGTSDTEVILAAYEEWGREMLTRFIGMFALAILDIREQCIFLARDFFGIKPFYYALAAGRFAFASEIKALLGLKGVTRHGNTGRLYEYLGFGLTDFGGETLFSDIFQLPAAHYAYVRLDRPYMVEPLRYWQIDPSYRQDISYDEAVDRLRTLFSESVRLHMRSDVPVGSCLSGGLDSSAIVMNMKKLQSPGQELHAFSFIVDDPVLSEERFVDMVGHAVAAACHKTSPGPEDMISDMEQLVYCQEEPFMSTSIYAQYRVFKLAHENGIKVMLDGQGADEIFAGYYSMIGARLTSLLTQGRIAAAWRVMKGAPQNMSAHRLHMLLFSVIRILPPAFMNSLIRLTDVPSFPVWVKQKWFLDRGTIPHYRTYGFGKEALRQELVKAINSLSLPQLLRYEDRNSMWFSIESRVPFCNPEIARFALSLPEQYLISNNGTTKSVLRESLKGILPEPVITREKVGFATPQNNWLKLQGAWAERSFNAADINRLPFLKKEVLQEIIGPTGASHNVSWPTWVWRCLNLLYWSRLFSVEWD